MGNMRLVPMALICFCIAGMGTGYPRSLVLEKICKESPPEKAEDNQYIIICPKTDSRPELDGKLDDKAWSRAAAATNFVRLDSGQAAKEPTEAYLACDDDNLYLAFKCFASDINKLARKIVNKSLDPDNLCHDDCIEIFLDPGYTRKEYFHIIINSAGVVWDSREILEEGAVKYEEKWHSRAQTGAAVYDKYWIVEAALPSSSLGNLTPGNIWGGNLAREEKKSWENSSWAPLKGGFQQPAQFGSLIIGGSDLIIMPFSLAAKGVGTNLLRVKIKNTTGKARPAGLELKTFQGEKNIGTESSAVNFQPDEVKLVTLPYCLPEAGIPYGLVLRITDSGQTGLTKKWQVTSPLPLELDLDKIEYYSSDKQAVLNFKLNIGEQDLANVKMRIALGGNNAGNNKLISEETVTGFLSPEGQLILNISDLAEGKYSVSVELLIGNNKITSCSKTLSIVKGPFD